MKFSKIAFVGLVAIAGALASARDAFDLKIANIDVLRDRSVQDELGITEGQRKTLNKFADTFTASNQAKIKEYEKAKKKVDGAFQKFTFDNYVKLRNNVLGAISDNQLKRLREITLQAAGPRSILDQVVATKIGLTTADYTKFRNAIVEGDQKVAKIKSDVGNKIKTKFKDQKQPKTKPEADALQKKIGEALNAEMKKHQTEIQQISAAQDAKVAKIVTKTHLEKLKALMGKPFVPKQQGAAKK